MAAVGLPDRVLNRFVGPQVGIVLALKQADVLHNQRNRTRCFDLRNFVDGSLDDQRTGHTAYGLNRRRPVLVRVIPVEAWRMVVRNLENIVEMFPRRNLDHRRKRIGGA